MSLARHVDADELIAGIKNLPAGAQKRANKAHQLASTVHTPYASRYSSQQDIPKFEISQDGCPAGVVQNILRDELDLDGRPNLNLARYTI